MRTQIRRLAMFTCITAATAFGGQLALAGTSAPTQQSEMKNCDQHHRKGHGGRNHVMRMAKELGLSEQQKSQAQELYKEQRFASKELFQELRAERRLLRTLVHSGSADEGAIRAQAAKVAQVEADVAVRKGETAKRFIALLTPQQVTKYKELMAKHEGRGKRFGCCDRMDAK